MSPPLEILHYVGCDDDRGGVISVIRNLASAGRFRCVLGVNAGATQAREPALPTQTLPRVEAETIGLRNAWHARAVAREVQAWLRGGAERRFHGHSRAGLLVGLWLSHWGEERVVVSVHCYGRQRWFYRWAARRLGARLFWLSPAMKKYYGVGDDSWRQCIPGCFGPAPVAARPKRYGEQIRLGGIGALVRWKNWGLVLTALARLPVELRGRFHFAHIGSADGSADSRAYAEELRNETATAEWRDRIEWRGQQASSAEFLAGIDCLVVASHGEPFSIALLEALRAGVPVLVADSGGARDIVQPGRHGWLFRSGDADDLAKQLVTLTRPETWPQTEMPSNEWDRFSPDVTAAQWVVVYESLG